jgi:ABC-type nitrate/sulfonate/bicarbonate transport system substrate-binding protein
VGRALTRAGIRKVANGQQIMTIKGQQRYYAVRNIGQWLKAKPDAVRKYVNTLYGGGK